MSASDRDACSRFKLEFETFVLQQFNVAPHQIHETPHALAFLDHCVSRPRVHSSQGRMLQAPLIRTLPERVSDLQRYYGSIGLACPFSDRAHRYAHELRDRIAPVRRRASVLLPNDIRELLDGCDESLPKRLRMRAALLLMWDTWARPSEILSRWYPNDIDATDDRGIIIVVQRSKANQGPLPEYFTIRHANDDDLCPVCNLRKWLDYLGKNWNGPLFPGLRGFEPTLQPLSTIGFNKAMSTIARRVWGKGRHYTSYSLRRGAATTAAALDWPSELIQAKLRHDFVIQISDYIDGHAMASATQSIL
jgi:integrase